jgi:hypothetical protein
VKRAPDRARDGAGDDEGEADEQPTHTPLVYMSASAVGSHSRATTINTATLSAVMVRPERHRRLDLFDEVLGKPVLGRVLSGLKCMPNYVCPLL